MSDDSSQPRPRLSLRVKKDTPPPTPAGMDEATQPAAPDVNAGAVPPRPEAETPAQEPPRTVSRLRLVADPVEEKSTATPPEPPPPRDDPKPPARKFVDAPPPPRRVLERQAAEAAAVEAEPATPPAEATQPYPTPAPEAPPRKFVDAPPPPRKTPKASPPVVATPPIPAPAAAASPPSEAALPPAPQAHATKRKRNRSAFAVSLLVSLVVSWYLAGDIFKSKREAEAGSAVQANPSGSLQPAQSDPVGPVTQLDPASQEGIETADARAPYPPPAQWEEPDPELARKVESLPVTSVLVRSEGTRIIVGGVVYKQGDILDAASGLRLVEAAPGRRVLIFADARNARYERKY